MSKQLAREFAEKFQNIVGDTTLETTDEFLINGINWCFRELPMVPHLERLFSKHYTRTLDAKNHYKFRLNEDFRRILNIPMINFYSSTGGKPCKLPVCNRDFVEFYNKNGLIDIKEPGIPCEYTIEKEDDDIYLVFDRPLNIPVIIDYIAYGVPKEVTNLDTDEIELSAIAENLMITALRSVWWQEADDLAFSGAALDYMDNKYYPEAIQALNRRWSSEAPIVLGG